MKIKDIVSYVWNHSIEIKFGERKSWENNTFVYEWVKNYYPNVWVDEGASGVYWFLLKDKTIKDLQNVKTPRNLGLRFTNIPETVKSHQEIFQENLCKPDKDGLLVIYNDHAKDVFAAIRSQFKLTNYTYTAIGLSQYSISRYDFRVRIFHTELPMDGLTVSEKIFVKNLLSEKVGREAIASYWRAYIGWPVLYKG